MAISKKIINQIENNCDDQDFKELLKEILSQEDKGIYRYKDKYDKIITDYINRKGNSQNG